MWAKIKSFFINTWAKIKAFLIKLFKIEAKVEEAVDDIQKLLNEPLLKETMAKYGVKNIDIKSVLNLNLSKVDPEVIAIVNKIKAIVNK